MRTFSKQGFFTAIAATAILALGAVGCDQAPTGEQVDEPKTLREVDVPEDFTFATSRGVSLTVAANADNMGVDTGALEVQRADGRVLYRGPLSSSQPLNLKLALPTKDNTVKLKLSANGTEQIAEVALDGNAANHTF